MARTPFNVRYQQEVRRAEKKLGNLGHLKGGAPRAYRPDELGDTINSEFIGYGFTATTTSKQVAGQMIDRRFLAIRNNSVEAFLVSFGQPASDNNSMVVGPGQQMVLDSWAPRNSVHIRTVSGTGNGVIIEG